MSGTVTHKAFLSKATAFQKDGQAAAVKVALGRRKVLLKAPKGEQVKETVESWEKKEETHPD